MGFAEEGHEVFSVGGHGGGAELVDAVFEFDSGVGEAGDGHEGHVSGDEDGLVGVGEFGLEPFELFGVDVAVEGVFVFVDGVESDDFPSADDFGPESAFHVEVVDGSAFAVEG